MKGFDYQGGQLHAESVSLEEIARTYGTPCYVYSAQEITRNIESLQQAFGDQPHRICYAVKANGNLSVLQYLHRLGCAFDIVSGGELARIRAIGGDLSRSVFSGVGKSVADIRLALEAGMGAFHVESRSELKRIAEVACDLEVVAPVSLRINPAIRVDTHPYIATGLKSSKFGIPMEEALEVYRLAAKTPGLKVRGISCHIGSQLVDFQPILDAVEQLVAVSDQLAEEGINLEYLDAGGGLGICYHHEHPPQADEYVKGLCAVLGDRPLTLLVEPGRFVMGNAGVLLTRVEYIKGTDESRFAVVDASMNELMRPVLYGAWHAILSVKEAQDRERLRYDVVGPVCESTDCLGRARRLAIEEGDYLAVYSAGAYAASMGCTYNARPLAAEVMVEKDQHRLIRPLGDIEHMYAGELSVLEAQEA